MSGVQSADVIVVGVGAVGSAAAWRLAAAGARVIGIDRFTPPHTMGSSHGETRITREAVGEGEQYVPLVQRGHALWEELEARSGTRLLERCGALLVGVADGSLSVHGRPGFVRATADIANKFGIAHELLSVAESRRRFPPMLLRGDELVYHEPGAGMLYPEHCISAQISAAAECGAVFRFAERVLEIVPGPNSVQVRTDKGVYEAGRLILSAGAWSPGLARRALSSVVVRRQVLHWFLPDRPEFFTAERMPVFIVSHGPSSEDSFYGFPLPPGHEASGVKIATENFTTSVDDPDLLDREVGREEGASLYRDHLQGRIGGLDATPLRSAVCAYSCTPDMNFHIGPHPESDRLLLASACSGHGFKHSAGVGDLLARHITEGELLPDFAVDAAA